MGQSVNKSISDMKKYCYTCSYYHEESPCFFYYSDAPTKKRCPNCTGSRDPKYC